MLNVYIDFDLLIHVKGTEARKLGQLAPWPQAQSSYQGTK